MNKNYRLKYLRDGYLKAAIILKNEALSHFQKKITVLQESGLTPKKEVFTFEEVREFVSEFVSICSKHIAQWTEEREQTELRKILNKEI